MEFCICADELRKALSKIEAAEKNGFMYCLSVFRFSQAGECVGDNLAMFSDLLEKGHPTDGKLNWGRFQQVSRRYKLVDDNLVPID